jgi:hypothetical protein
MTGATMPKNPIHKLSGADLRRMNPTQWKKFYSQVDAVSRRLLSQVRKEVDTYGPWVYARFWRLASEIPVIKNRIDWRNALLKEYEELANRQLRMLGRRKNPERNQERNSEIMRLYHLGLMPGRILLAIKKRWPRLENGKSINTNAIKSVIRNRTTRRRRRIGGR